MSTKPTQPLKQFSPSYDYFQLLRELEHLHAILNDRLLSATAQADLKTNYVAGDLGTAAAIATAFNSTNFAINAILNKIRISG